MDSPYAILLPMTLRMSWLFPAELRKNWCPELSMANDVFNCEGKWAIFPLLAISVHVMFSFVDDIWVREHIYRRVEEQCRELDKCSS